MGYPDMGAGIYSRALNYKDWFNFNCAVRVHYNSLEHLGWTLPLMLVNGLFFPKLTTTFGMIILVGREFYRYGYMTNDGPNSHIRELGAIPLNVAELLIASSLIFVFARYRVGPFLKRIKFI